MCIKKSLTHILSTQAKNIPIRKEGKKVITTTTKTIKVIYTDELKNKTRQVFETVVKQLQSCFDSGLHNFLSTQFRIFRNIIL